MKITKKSKIIIFLVIGILLLIIIIGVFVGGRSSSGSNALNQVLPIGSIWASPIRPSIKHPTKGKINLNSMSIFTNKQTYWNTGTQIGFFPGYYKYSLTNILTNKKTNNDNTLLSSAKLYYAEGAVTHNYENVSANINFQYTKNNENLFNVLSVFSWIGGRRLTNDWKPSFQNTTTSTPSELTSINNKISTKINPFLSKLKQGQKLIINKINYYYNFTILSHGEFWTDRVELNIAININSIGYSIINK